MKDPVQTHICKQIIDREMEEECSYDHNINRPGAKLKPDKKNQAEAGDLRNFHFEKKGQGDQGRVRFQYFQIPDFFIVIKK